VSHSSDHTPLALPGQIDPDPGLALGRGLPNIPWSVRQQDRIYNMLLAGGQGSGKSSMLMRIALSDILAPNTATVVLDMKGSLSERLLRLTPPDIPKRWWDEEAQDWREGTKRVWYLDLGHPAFGLTPLRVEPGWTPTGLADEFARIADAITRSLLDLYPGQIMGSSEDLIERAVVGTMAIAWWEHEQRCERERRAPAQHGFSGSFEVLSQMFAPSDRFEDEEAGRGRRRVQPNRWHQAAGRACQKLPNLDQVADTLLYEIPRQARDNLTDIAKRMEAPANKIRPLVGAAASVRRFVGHPERLSLRSVIEAHDTLIVNPRIELIGEDQASILTNFIVHMLDLQMKRQVAVPQSHRPRVSLIIDEAHRLITDTLITMTATHREAGLTVAAAVQYVSQLGADAPSAARREKIIKGVGNLMQSKFLFRMSDSEDADQHSQIFRSVYETMVRADPTSRARMPFDPARMQTLRDHHALVSLVCTPGNGGGATRLPAFVSQTFRMPELDEISDGWRAEHLSRQSEMFSRYPEDMSALASHEVPAGLGGQARPTTSSAPSRADAREVAEQTIGKMPEGAMRKASTPAADRAAAAADAAASELRTGKTARASSYDTQLFSREPKGSVNETPTPDRTVEHGHPPRSQPQHPPGRPVEREQPPEGEGEVPIPRWESVGGVEIEHSDTPETGREPALKPSRVLEVACQATTQALPHHDLGPATEQAQQALREVATFEAIARVGEWMIAGDDIRTEAKRAARQAHDQVLAESEAAGIDKEEGQRAAERRARRVAAAKLATHPDAAWRTPAAQLSLSDADAHTLETIARLKFAVPRLLGSLLEERPSERVLRERVARLHDAGLIARSDVSIEGRRGRRPRLFTVAPRGLDYLRARHEELRPDGEPPTYLQPSRPLPQTGNGEEVPRELAIQLVLASLRQYGGPATQVHWHTTRMPGGRWDIGMIHRDRRDRGLRLADLLPAPGVGAHGEQMDAPVVLEPDLSLELQGPVGPRRGALDMLVEMGRNGKAARDTERFTAYDHFLGGWCLRTRRWGYERRGRPIVVFVALSPKLLFTLLRTADSAMTLGFSNAGRYDPAEFDYPGRAHVAFTCLEWLLGGQALALRLPALPPRVRGAETELRPERVALLPEEWWPSQKHPR
jgi:hypothetical protein